MFGSRFIHIMYTECTKIKKKKIRRQRLISDQKVGRKLRKSRDLTVLMSKFVQRQSQYTLIVQFAAQLQL